MFRSLKIIQWNCRSIIPKIPEFTKNSLGADIIVLYETWLSSDKTVDFKGFNYARFDRLNKQGVVWPSLSEKD